MSCSVLKASTISDAMLLDDVIKGNKVKALPLHVCFINLTGEVALHAVA